MASEISKKQIVANQLNAQRSTGPSTIAGKKRVSSNALKHGLTASDVVLPNESADEFESFREDLLVDLAPEGGLESAFAEQVVADFWRLRRVQILEAALYRRGCQEIIVEQAKNDVKATDLAASLQKPIPSDQTAYEEAEERLEEAQAQLNELLLNVARAFAANTVPLTNLSRYESTLSRSLHRNLHELQRLQAARAGEYVAPPSVVDVNINLPEPPTPDIGSTDEKDREQEQE